MTARPGAVPNAAPTPRQLLTICAWCGAVIKEGRLPVSHGMCNPPCMQARACGFTEAVQES